MLMNKLLFFIITVYSMAIFQPGPAPVRAQEEMMNDTMLMFVGEELYTVSAASRREESVRKASAAVTVLGRKELRRYRTLTDALRSVPGFYIDHSGIKEQVFLRGVADSFLMLIDGVPMANDSSNIDYPRGPDLSLDYVEKVEIVRGPGSALWGADAFSGVINVVTRKGGDAEGLTLSAEAGSFDSEAGRCLVGYKQGEVDFLAFASYTSTLGFEDDSSPVRTRKVGRNDGKFRELYGKLNVGKTLTISGRYSNYSNYFTYNDLIEHKGLESTPFSFLQLSYEDQWRENLRAQIKVYGSYFENYIKENYIDQDFRPIASLESELDQGNWQYGIDTKFDIDFNDHLLSLGFSWEYDDVDTRRFDVLARFSPELRYIGTVTVHPSFKSSRVGFYLQDIYEITDTVSLTAGVRLDKHEDFRRNISPRISLVWLPDGELDLQLFFGQAYRTPDLYALSIDPGVEEEKITSFEGQFTVRPDKRLTLQGSYFYHILEDLLENTIQGRFDADETEVVQGTELSVDIRPFQSLSLYANHTLLFGERQRDDPNVINLRFVTDDGRGFYNRESVFHLAPDHIANIGATFRWGRHIAANVEAHYRDARDIEQDFYDVQKSSLSPYWTTDVNVFVTDLLQGRLDLNLRVRNLFNKTYEYRGTTTLLQGPERSWFLEARWTF